ncbi:hypothetical protein M422DRAFT_39133, partial [Sphaerobolus stellatus SS14]
MSFRFRQPHKPVLALSKVCHLWRELIANYPPFWSTINTSYVGNEEALKMWIQYSESCPLKLYMDVSEIGSTLRGSIVDVLSTNFGRCQHITVGGSPFRVYDVLFADNRQSTCLRSLTVRNQYTYEKGPVEKYIHCPKLESLRLYGAGMTLMSISSLGALRCLHIVLCEGFSHRPHRNDTIPFSKWLEIVTLSQNLEELHLDMTYVNLQALEESTTSKKPTFGMRLRQLKLMLDKDCSEASLSLSILKCIKAPNLEYLQIDGSRWVSGQELFQYLHNLLTDCQATLRRLTLKEFELSIAEARVLLSHAPNVERLKISSESFFVALSTPLEGTSSSQVYLCPKLKQLTITPDRGANMQLVTLLEKRTPPENWRNLPSRDDGHCYLIRVDLQVYSGPRWKQRVLQYLFALNSREGLTLLGLDALFR